MRATVRLLDERTLLAAIRATRARWFVIAFTLGEMSDGDELEVRDDLAAGQYFVCGENLTTGEQAYFTVERSGVTEGEAFDLVRHG
jgi:hypothetical protein